MEAGLVPKCHSIPEFLVQRSFQIPISRVEVRVGHMGESLAIVIAGNWVGMPGKNVLHVLCELTRSFGVIGLYLEVWSGKEGPVRPHLGDIHVSLAWEERWGTVCTFLSPGRNGARYSRFSPLGGTVGGKQYAPWEERKQYPPPPTPSRPHIAF